METLKHDMATTDPQPSEPTRVPLTPLVARRLIVQCFREHDQWSRRDLVNAIERKHRNEGGLPGAQSPTAVVKKVLGELRAEGIARPVSKGLWRYQSDPESDSAATDAPSATANGSDEMEDDEDDERSGLSIEEEVGSGQQLVYVYYNPNDRRLAEIQGRLRWECKVGATDGEVDLRILGQGVRTALSRLPVVGLVIRTDDARSLEAILHRSLRLTDCAVVDSPGTEWFMTSPSVIKEWYVAFTTALAHLSSGAG